MDMSFDATCRLGAACSDEMATLLSGAGVYLASLYSTFWASSYVTAGSLFMMSDSGLLSWSVPAANEKQETGALSLRTYSVAMNALLGQLQGEHARAAAAVFSSGQQALRVRWLRIAEQPDSMAGMLPSGLAPGAWGDAQEIVSNTHIATLLHRSRTGGLEQGALPLPQHRFWLRRDLDGVLLGSVPDPGWGVAGWRHDGRDVLFQVADASGHWWGMYAVDSLDLLRANAWLPFCVLGLATGSLLLAVGYRRWFRRCVTHPGIRAHQCLTENGLMMGTWLDILPVPVCMLSQNRGEILMGNAQALALLGALGIRSADSTPASRQLLARTRHGQRPGCVEGFLASDGSVQQVKYAMARYMRQDVILCAFMDDRCLPNTGSVLVPQPVLRVGDIVAGRFDAMSHAVRTPLYGIVGPLELLSMTSLDQTQREYVEQTRMSADVLQGLMCNLLDLSMLEAGRMTLRQVEFDLRALVEERAGTHAARAQQKGLLLFSCVDVAVPCRLMGDRGRIQQVIDNLIDNAIRFTEQGHIIIRLSCVGMQEDKAVVSLQVADSGIGVSVQDHPRLFRPFGMPVVPASASPGGGLGLAVCAFLARLMGSEIHLASAPGLGSLFSVSLALEARSDMAEDVPDLHGVRVHVRSPHHELTGHVQTWFRHWGAEVVTDMDAACGGRDVLLLDLLLPDIDPPEQWQGPYLSVVSQGCPDIDAYSVRSLGEGVWRYMHGKLAWQQAPSISCHLPLAVLVVDDHPVSRVILTQQLEKLGCHVVAAAGAEEALTLWTLTTFDVVLTDIDMPGMDGCMLARTLRARGVQCAILGVSANIADDLEIRCLQAGMEALMDKPVTLSMLQRHLPLASPILRDTCSPMRGSASNLPEIPAMYRDIFYETMQTDVQLLVQCAQDGDTCAIRQILHRIRGALVVVGWGDIAAQCEEIEEKVELSNWNEHYSQELDALILVLQRLVSPQSLLI